MVSWGVDFWLRPKPGTIGDHVPDVRTLVMNTVEHDAKANPAGLAAAMVGLAERSGVRWWAGL